MTNVWTPEVPPHRARKARRKWCRGKVGVEHVTDIRRRVYGRDQPGPCKPLRSDGSWWCRHETYCTICGKILDRSLPNGECPDYRDQAVHSPVQSQ